MKLICTQENLNQALLYLERIVGRQSSLPILSNILFETEKGRLKISATNLEIGIIVYIGAKIEKEGKIAIPAKIISHFIHNLPSGDVLHLESDTEGMKIESDTYKIKIKGLNGEDFPIIPQYSKKYPFSFPAQDLKNALTRILFCVSLNNARLELTGAHISFYKEEIHIAATDSFRLAEEIIPYISQEDKYDEFISTTPTLIIPGSTLQEIIRVITPESGSINFAVEENQIFFEIDGVQIISRLINGKYPDYKQIIPKTFSFQALFDREAFQRAVRIAGSFSSSASSEVTLILNPEEKRCTLTSASQEIGENKTLLPIEILKGDIPLTIVFNPRYLSEGLSALSGEKCLFYANDGGTPAALKMADENDGVKRGDYLYLIMPIRK